MLRTRPQTMERISCREASFLCAARSSSPRPLPPKGGGLQHPERTIAITAGHQLEEGPPHDLGEARDAILAVHRPLPAQIDLRCLGDCPERQEKARLHRRALADPTGRLELTLADAVDRLA